MMERLVSTLSYLNIATANHKYILEFNSVLNTIALDSCTGKTSLFNIIKRQLYLSLEHNFTNVRAVTDVSVIPIVEPGELRLLEASLQAVSKL